MAKLQLTPNDISNLLRDHPEIELELVKEASVQVADAMSRKITKELVLARITQEMDAIVIDKINYRDSKLSSMAEGLINRKVSASLDELFSTKLNTVVMGMIRQEIKDSIPQLLRSIERELQKNIDTMIRDTLVQTLLTAKK